MIRDEAGEVSRHCIIKGLLARCTGLSSVPLKGHAGLEFR